ncbi:hypothetical protein H7169_03580 [Candidatus Gracilibacteria bacterium]|nr:hypothetical protein [Candidatus Gracilibacteria bacterium]
MGNEYSRSRSSTTSIPWLWIGMLGALVAVIFFARSFSSETSVDTDRPHMMISPDTSVSTVFISMTESSKNRITGTGGQPLYVGDKSISVETGGANASNGHVSIDIDERTELTYSNHTATGDRLRLAKGRIWIEQTSYMSTIDMKNLVVSVKTGDIIMLEQNNQIYSTVYALKGDAEITTSVGIYILKAGNRIMVSASDLANPGLKLATLVGDIDESILESPLFIKNNGKSLLNNIQSKTGVTLSGSVGSGSIGSSIAMITIIEPLEGSRVTTATVPVRGSINSTDVKRVTLNDQEAIISPVNSTFTFAEFPLGAEINNIVYKVYNADGKQLEKGVITVYGSKGAADQSTMRLLANASPISSKDFRIVSPASNPYVMTDSAIKVQGTVTKDAVSYILVNDYRLQKYIPGSTTWYYYANMSSSTLKDGINLYTIKFMGNKDEVLYTQLFTIIKESKNATLSGESSR